jgi:seryl-tRNA synthetase
MFIRISDAYHTLRVEELRLTGDYLAKREEEKEQARAERERQREEDTARRELERETQRLRREQDHYATALARLHAAGDSAAVAEMEAKLREIDEAIRGVQERAANIRAGYVYVISNIGAFGPNMIKIGMTRRLEPMDRVRELGDASVPFRFDVHALIFSHDAVGLENQLHNEFTAQRVNRVNSHREFFYATPAEVRQALARIAGNHLIEYRDQPDALEWRASGQHATTTPSRSS